MNKWLNQYLTFIHILFNLRGYGTPSTSTPDILRTYRNPSGFLPSFLRWFYRSYKHSLSIIKPLSVIPHGSGTLQTWSGHSRTNDRQRDLDGHVTPVRSTKIFRRLNRDSRVLFPLSLDTCIARDLINDITMSCSISLPNNATWLVPTSDIPVIKSHAAQLLDITSPSGPLSIFPSHGRTNPALDIYCLYGFLRIPEHTFITTVLPDGVWCYLSTLGRQWLI